VRDDKAKAEFFSELKLDPEQIHEAIMGEITPIKELTAYGKVLDPLICSTEKALCDAHQLRSVARPDQRAYLGVWREDRSVIVDVEGSLEGTLAYLVGVRSQQQRIFGKHYKRRKAYTEGAKRGWLERNVAAIVAYSQARPIDPDHAALRSAGIFFYLGYDIASLSDLTRIQALARAEQDRIRRAFNKLRRRAVDHFRSSNREVLQEVLQRWPQD